MKSLDDINNKNRSGEGAVSLENNLIYYAEASAFNWSALSTRSQGASISVRPKWPYAAVLA
jgi:hypothetical protein